MTTESDDDDDDDILGEEENDILTNDLLTRELPQQNTPNVEAMAYESGRMEGYTFYFLNVFIYSILILIACKSPKMLEASILT